MVKAIGANLTRSEKSLGGHMTPRKETTLTVANDIYIMESRHDATGR